MRFVLLILGLVLLGAGLLDAFQTIILPRRPVARFRLTRLFFIATWLPWKAVVSRLPSARRREQYFSIYGPLALLLLFGFWAAVLVTSFGFIYFGLRAPFSDPWHPVSALARLESCFYVSGSTLFTLGLGDVLPRDHLGRLLVVTEAGVGLGFVALVIGFVPVLYTAFSAREMTVALLDARAGSPPTAGELLARHRFEGGDQALVALLEEWERWCASMLETHISYPILCYYRSQHDNQSWLSALTAMLDTCALLITSIHGPSQRQAQLTFAIGRHVLVDVGHVFRRDPVKLSAAAAGRLGPEDFCKLCDLLRESGVSLCGDLDVQERLKTLRGLYEPQATALAEYLRLELPHWMPPAPNAAKPDMWTSIARLRSGGAARPVVTHVSAQATASHFTDDDPFV